MPVVNETCQSNVDESVPGHSNDKVEKLLNDEVKPISSAARS